MHSIFATRLEDPSECLNIGQLLLEFLHGLFLLSSAHVSLCFFPTFCPRMPVLPRDATIRIRVESNPEPYDAGVHMQKLMAVAQSHGHVRTRCPKELL